MIRRLDEVILGKANKITIEEVYVEMKRYLLIQDHTKFKSKISTQDQENENQREILRESIQQLNESISKDIFSAVRRATTQMQKQLTTNESSSQGTSLSMKDLKFLL